MGHEFNDLPVLPDAEPVGAAPSGPAIEEAGTSTQHAGAGSGSDSDINPDKILQRSTPAAGAEGSRKWAASPEAGAGAEDKSA